MGVVLLLLKETNDLGMVHVFKDILRLAAVLLVISEGFRFH